MLVSRQCNNRQESVGRAQEPAFGTTDILRLNAGADTNARRGSVSQDGDHQTAKFSVRDGTDLCRMNRDAVATLFKALERLGLVELATPGSFSRKVRHAAEWRLTTDICDATGAVPFKAFMRWRPRLARFTVPPLPRRIYSSHRPCFFRGGEWIANDGHSATAADGFSVAIARAHEGALEVYSF
jgi:hypothetical protein